jgi:hypothetical protein
MKRIVITILILTGFTLLVLAGCSAPGATAVPTSSPAGAAEDCSTVPTPSVDVAALITEKLQNHHAEDRIYSAVHTREEWNTTLDRMIGYGAVISEEEKQVIIDYLLCFKP